jgi:hypothetical protein
MLVGSIFGSLFWMLFYIGENSNDLNSAPVCMRCSAYTIVQGLLSGLIAVYFVGPIIFKTTPDYIDELFIGFNFGLFTRAIAPALLRMAPEWAQNFITRWLGKPPQK